MGGGARAHAADGGDPQTFEFFDPSTHKPLVRGEEHVTRDGGDLVKHTVYKTLDGEAAQVEDARYNADSLKLATYHFEDHLSGETADVKVKDGHAHVQYRDDAKSEMKQDDIDWGPDAISGKALPEMILRNWDKLAGGAAIPFELYVPFRLECMAFQAVRKPLPDGQVAIVVEPRNWMIRQLAPQITFVFSAATPPKLALYRGPSMVDIAGESNKKVEIVFK
jgi:hypothetical protein